MPAIQNAVAVQAVQAVVNPADNVATLTSAAYDTVGFEGLLEFDQHIGTFTGSPTWTGQLTHCDTSGGTYANVTGGAYVATAAANELQRLLIDRNSLKRFVKYVGTLAGGSTPHVVVGVTCRGVKKVQ